MIPLIQRNHWRTGPSQEQRGKDEPKTGEKSVDKKKPTDAPAGDAKPSSIDDEAIKEVLKGEERPNSLI